MDSDIRLFRRAAALLGGLKSRWAHWFGLWRREQRHKGQLRSYPAPSAQLSTAGQNREKRGLSERSEIASSAAPVLAEERREPVALAKGKSLGCISFAYFSFVQAKKSRVGARHRALSKTNLREALKHRSKASARHRALSKPTCAKRSKKTSVRKKKHPATRVSGRVFSSPPCGHSVVYAGGVEAWLDILSRRNVRYADARPPCSPPHGLRRSRYRGREHSRAPCRHVRRAPS